MIFKKFLNIINYYYEHHQYFDIFALIHKNNLIFKYLKIKWKQFLQMCMKIKLGEIMVL
jgi:hypothetical protein